MHQWRICCQLRPTGQSRRVEFAGEDRAALIAKGISSVSQTVRSRLLLKVVGVHREAVDGNDRMAELDLLQYLLFSYDSALAARAFRSRSKGRRQRS